MKIFDWILLGVVASFYLQTMLTTGFSLTILVSLDLISSHLGSVRAFHPSRYGNLKTVEVKHFGGVDQVVYLI